jgi:hypothetical protein
VFQVTPQSAAEVPLDDVEAGDCVVLGESSLTQNSVTFRAFNAGSGYCTSIPLTDCEEPPPE